MTSGKRLADQHVVYDGYWRVRRIVLEDQADPSDRLVRDIVEARTASATLLFDSARQTVLLVRQFRPAPFLAFGVQSLLEVCAGVADPGETPEACAVREAYEETGVVVVAPRHVCRVFTSPGVCTERLDLFIGDYSQASRTGDGGGLAHEGEATEPVEMPFEDAIAAIGDGRIVDAKSIILLQRLALEQALGSARAGSS